MTTIGVLLVFIMLCACIPVNQIQNAQAHTFQPHIPTFGLYCNDKEVIQMGTVIYDLSNIDAVLQGKGTMQSYYKLSAINRTVEFSIPFIASIENSPSFSVTANDKKINGSIWYGDAFFSSEKDTNFYNLIDQTYSPVIPEYLYGTLYTIIPDDETISIELSFAEGKKNTFIYETSNSLTGSNTESGTYTWTFNYALEIPEYKFFILGENSDYSFSCGSVYQTETMTCKEFIDCQYAALKEHYIACGISSIDFLYSMFNKILYHKQSITYGDLFLNLTNVQRFNIYKFSLNIDTDIVVSYELPTNVMSNFAFTPTIYLVEQKNLGNYPIRYTVKLNNELPYIIEASVKTEKNGIIYNAEIAEDYYFVFCSSEKPENAIFQNDDNNNKILMVCCFITSSIAFVVLIVLIVLIGYGIRRNHKRG